jgi:beta-galactosidase
MLARFLLGALLAASIAGCHSTSTAPPAPEQLTFPQGFVFGTAIAGFQADMGCPTLPASVCNDPNSDWYQFVTSPATLNDPADYLSGDPPSAGPGDYELYESDFDLAQNDLKSTSLRFSFEWSRIFPTATDAAEGYTALKALADPTAVAHYHAVLAALKARGIRPLVTLNHYTLPSWIHDAVGCHEDLATCSPRGWLDSARTIKEIAKYAGFAAQEFGGEVDWWATENEPLAVVLAGYAFPTAQRTNPPAVLLQLTDAKAVIVAMIQAHAAMYDAIKAGDTVDADGDGTASMVGLVYNIAPTTPNDPTDPYDVSAAKNLYYLYNLAFLNAVAKGDLDAGLTGTAVHQDSLAGRMDYIGINYYVRVVVMGTTSPFLPDLSPLSNFNPLSLQQDSNYPHGIYEAAMLVESYGLPAVVTENGVADPDDDGTGPGYIVQNLTWLSRAIRDGADVRGYHYWTLMDNYEWNHGMDNIRMGLYAVDKTDPMKQRTPRKGVATFAAIAAAGQVPADLAAQYPAPAPTD